jgi:hypothetical protein
MWGGPVARPNHFAFTRNARAAGPENAGNHLVLQMDVPFAQSKCR